MSGKYTGSSYASSSSSSTTTSKPPKLTKRQKQAFKRNQKKLLKEAAAASNRGDKQPNKSSAAATSVSSSLLSFGTKEEQKETVKEEPVEETSSEEEELDPTTDSEEEEVMNVEDRGPGFWHNGVWVAAMLHQPKSIHELMQDWKQSMQDKNIKFDADDEMSALISAQATYYASLSQARDDAVQAASLADPELGALLNTPAPSAGSTKSVFSWETHVNTPPIPVLPPESEDPADQRAKHLLSLAKDHGVSGPPMFCFVYLIAVMVRNYTLPWLTGTEDVDQSAMHACSMRETAEEAIVVWQIDNADDILDKKGFDLFSAFATENPFQIMCQSTIQRHMRTSAVKASTNPGGTQRYEATRRAYYAAKAKQRNRTAFSPGLTPGEERLIKEFERRENSGGNKAKPSHYVNQNAVCYLSLALTIFGMFYQLACAAGVYSFEETVQMVMQLFAYVHFASSEGDKKMQTCLGNLAGEEMCGVDIAQFWGTVFQSDFYSRCEDAGRRNTPNCKLTMKRLHRLCALLTGMPSLWNLCRFVGLTGIGLLFNLFHLEQRIEQLTGVNDTKLHYAESIVWYITLGKQSIINPLTDDQGQHAEALLAQILNIGNYRAIRYRPNATCFERGQVLIGRAVQLNPLVDNPANQLPPAARNP